MKTALIVDDNAFILESLQTMLKPEGYECVKARNGNEALDALAKQRFDAVITDINMPEKDGVQLMQEMRDLGLNMTIIAISGDDQDYKADQPLNVASYYADGVIKKPVKKADLMAMLNDESGGSIEDALRNL